MSRLDWGARSVQAGFLAALVLVWILINRAELITPIFVPPFERVVTAFWRIIANGEVFEPLSVTLRTLAVAYVVSLTFGLTVGYVIGRSRWAVTVFEPLLAGLFAIPIVIFLPVFILLFGIGPESKMAFGATYAFFPIVLNTIGGVSQVDQRFVMVARSLGATDAQMFRRVLLPGALPVIMTGVRIGFIIGFLAIIGGETIAGFQGLGSQIVRLAEGMNTVDMFAYVFFVIVIAGVLQVALSWLQKQFSQAEGAG